MPDYDLNEVHSDAPIGTPHGEDAAATESYSYVGDIDVHGRLDAAATIERLQRENAELNEEVELLQRELSQCCQCRFDELKQIEECYYHQFKRERVEAERDRLAVALEELLKKIGGYISQIPAHNRDDHTCPLCEAYEAARSALAARKER